MADFTSANDIRVRKHMGKGGRKLAPGFVIRNMQDMGLEQKGEKTQRVAVGVGGCVLRKEEHD